MSQQNEITDIKKKILSTGIRVGTAVKTKFMIPYVTQASPEGLYLMDLDITLARIQTAAKFINRVNIEDVIVCSGREYANTPIEKFCEITDATKMLGRFIPANNRGRKSLATIYWLLAREILLEKGEIKNDNQMKYEIDDFETKITEEEEIE